MISAVLITLNEEENIEEALKSLKDVAQEIIVVDCGSNDKTLEIAKKNGAITFFRKFDNFANQKNWAVSKATGDWIISLDADEEITEDLAKEIKEAVKSHEFVGFLIPRKNFILGKEIKYSRWSPDTHIWLWKKDLGKWVGEVHEEVKVIGKVGLLKNSKIHNSHKTISEFVEANNKYSGLEAEALFKKGIKFAFGVMMWQSFFEFFIRYIYKKGFLDGKRGLILSYLMGIYIFTVWIKLWELSRQSNK